MQKGLIAALLWAATAATSAALLSPPAATAQRPSQTPTEQPPARSLPKPPPGRWFSTRLWVPHDWTWTTAPWTDPGRPYAAIEAAVLAKLKAATPEQAIALFERWKEAGQQAPGDPKKAFTWALAAYLLDNRDLLPNELPDLRAAAQALDRADPRNVARYARLRFIIEGWKFPKFELLPAGRRLVAKNPNDPTARYLLARLLIWSPDKDKRREGLAHAETLAKRYPAPQYRLLVAAAHEENWDREKDPEEARKAVQEFRGYLAALPEGDAARPRILKRIARLQGGT